MNKSHTEYCIIDGHRSCVQAPVCRVDTKRRHKVICYIELRVQQAADSAWPPLLLVGNAESIQNLCSYSYLYFLLLFL